jgi:heme/copper-type cytochrome/quinol oxidase subunit 2
MNLTTTTDSSRDTTINNMLIIFVIFCLVLFLTFVALIVYILKVKKTSKVYPSVIDVSVRGIDEDF